MTAFYMWQHNEQLGIRRKCEKLIRILGNSQEFEFLLFDMMLKCDILEVLLCAIALS